MSKHKSPHLILNWILRKGDTLYAPFADEAIVFTLEDNIPHILNRSASRIYELTDGRKRVKEVISEICDEFDVAPEKAKEDAIELFLNLLEKKIVKWYGGKKTDERD